MQSDDLKFVSRECLTERSKSCHQMVRGSKAYAHVRMKKNALGLPTMSCELTYYQRDWKSSSVCVLGQNSVDVEEWSRRCRPSRATRSPRSRSPAPRTWNLPRIQFNNHQPLLPPPPMYPSPLLAALLSSREPRIGYAWSVASSIRLTPLIIFPIILFRKDAGSTKVIAVGLWKLAWDGTEVSTICQARVI